MVGVVVVVLMAVLVFEAVVVVGSLLLVVLRCWCAVMLVRCVVARAVHELLLEPKSWRCHQLHIPMKRILKNVCVSSK